MWTARVCGPPGGLATLQQLGTCRLKCGITERLGATITGLFLA